MNRRRALEILAFAVSLAAGDGWLRHAIAGADHACECADDHGCKCDNDHPFKSDARECKRPVRASTGRAEAGRDCSGETYARSDQALRPQGIERRKDRDHPLERVQARGEGKIKATGDKGAIREMRNKRRWVK